MTLKPPEPWPSPDVRTPAERALQAIGMILEEPEGLYIGTLASRIEHLVALGLRSQHAAAMGDLEPGEGLGAMGIDLASGRDLSTFRVDVPGLPLGVAMLVAEILKHLAGRRPPATPRAARIRELALELDQELGRMALSAAAANDDPAREVERLALAIAEGSILIALSARAKAARASTLPSAAREE